MQYAHFVFQIRILIYLISFINRVSHEGFSFFLSLYFFQARNQGAKKRDAGENFFSFFFKSNAWFVFTVVYDFLYYIVNVRYN